MRHYAVVFARTAETHLNTLLQFLTTASSRAAAARYTAAIVAHCESLGTFPFRGPARDDLRPGIRLTTYRKRTTIAYSVEQDRVVILGVFYGGRDFEHILKDDSDMQL